MRLRRWSVVWTDGRRVRVSAHRFTEAGAWRTVHRAGPAVAPGWWEVRERGDLRTLRVFLDENAAGMQL